MRQASAARQLGLLSSDQPETLVLYTYSNSDPEYERNLRFFVEHGMAEGDGCEYVIIVQEVSKKRKKRQDYPTSAVALCMRGECLKTLRPCCVQMVSTMHSLRHLLQPQECIYAFCQP